MFDLPTGELTSHVNIFFQHYHVSTNISKKSDASLGYLQLQIGTLQNPFSLDYTRWGILTHLSWVKMLRKSLHHFDTTLYMAYPTISFPCKCNQVIVEIILSHDLNPTAIRGLNRCRVEMEPLFLLDIATADGKYLEHFVFDLGGHAKQSHYNFPRERSTKKDWDGRIHFWHAFTTTVGKLKAPLGKWKNPTHQIWMWYYRQEGNELCHLSGDRIKHIRQATGWQCTRSTMTYQFTQEETSPSSYPVIILSRNNVNRLQEGLPLPTISSDLTLFWVFIAKWGRNWMWEGIDATQQTKMDTT